MGSILALIFLLLNVLMVGLMFEPLDWISWLHWPRWLGLGIIGLLLSWCLGND